MNDYILHCTNEKGETLYKAHYDSLPDAISDAEQFVGDLFIMYTKEKMGTKISAFSDNENLKWNFRCYNAETNATKEYNYSIIQ